MLAFGVSLLRLLCLAPRHLRSALLCLVKSSDRRCRRRCARCARHHYALLCLVMAIAAIVVPAAAPVAWILKYECLRSRSRPVNVQQTTKAILAD